jgi:hypothetical protein
MPTLFLSPMRLWFVSSGAHGDGERLRQHAFWECAIAQAVRTQVQCGLGGSLLQQWHLWLVDPPLLSVRWSVGLWCWPLSEQWSRVGNACVLWFVRLCSRPFPKLPPPSGLPRMIFWSASHNFARHDRPVPAKCWDEVGPDHPFLSVPIQVPLRLCLAVASSIAISWMFARLQYSVRKAMLSTHFRAIWHAMSDFSMPLRFASLCLDPFGTPGMVGGVVVLCRNWCNIIIITVMLLLSH